MGAQQHPVGGGPRAGWAALPEHWPEYAIEAAALGTFMISACVFGTLFEHLASPVRQALPDSRVRNFLMGLMMGSTAVAIIYSPWGRRSGAHMNPALTVTFFRLGRIEPIDAALYVGAQFAGALAGVALAGTLLPVVADPPVRFVATVPGAAGPTVAFLAEVVIAFVLMSVVLRTSNHPRMNRFTGLFAGLLVASYITLEAPLSGMSLNPARTLASAIGAREFSFLWIYFIAPLGGMLLAAEVYLRRPGARVFCAKLNHHGAGRCIFRCQFDDIATPPRAVGKLTIPAVTTAAARQPAQHRN